MVRVSYDQKPYRRALMETYGARCTPSPSPETQSGRAILAQRADHPGSLGIAISEAVEVAAQRDDTKYALGSVLNHVLLHQTVIGHRGDGADGAGRRLPGRDRRLHRRRLELRGHRVPVPRRAAARRPQGRHRGHRAGGLPEPHPRPLRLRLRGHGAPDAAHQDAHARLDVHPARLPRGRPALPRDGAAGLAPEGARADRRARATTSPRCSRRACSSRGPRASSRPPRPTTR